MKTQLIVDTQTLEILSVHTGKGSQHDFKLFKNTLILEIHDIRQCRQLCNSHTLDSRYISLPPHHNDHHLLLQIHRPQAQTAPLFDEVHRCMQGLKTKINEHNFSYFSLSKMIYFVL